ncbi:MAG: PAS domain S-box protein [Verrucomicrobia bacterium]|nr:PAS domain S-box protein [Verrucomicrobiota bacterium]
MNRPQQGQRIVRLVRALTGLGLLMVVITIGIIGWTLARVRTERGLATAEQEQLNGASDQLRQRAVASRVELQAMLDETLSLTNRAQAVPGLIEFIADQPDQSYSGARPMSEQFAPLIGRLADVSRRGQEWRASYDPVWQDVSRQRTLGQVRALITQLRGAVEALEGRRRLDDAIKHRRWRTTTNDTSPQLARAILEEQGREQSQGVNDFKGVLAECARLVELLGGEEQLDSLADLKDNKLKPVLDRLSRTITSFGTNAAAGSLTPAAAERLQAAISGTATNGGLFTLRHDALRLRREREKMKLELASLFHDIEAASAGFAQSAQARTTALTQQMEGSLAAGWQQMLYVGGGCSALFLWLAWMISRGIGGQVRAIDRARAEAVQENAERRQAEEALRKNEAQLQTIVENLAEGVAVSDLDGQLLHFNRAALAMHGFASLDETRRHVSEFAGMFELSDMNGAALSVEQWPLSRVLRGENLRDLDVRVRRPAAGWERVFSYGGSLVHDADGKSLMAVVTISDITARKKADEQRARLVDFLEASLNEVYVFDPESLRFNYVNRSARQNLGYTTEQIAKLTPLDLKPEFTEASFRRMVGPLVDGTTPKHVFQTFHRRADGTDYSVEVCLQLVASGTERVFLAIINDITERKRAEEELQRSKAFLHSVIENLPISVFIKDAKDLRFILWNKAGEKLTGFSNQEMVGKNDYDFFPSEDAEKFIAIDRQVLTSGQKLEIPEEQLQTRHKGIRTLQVTKVPILNGEREAEFLLGIAEDITERKHSETLLAKAHKELLEVSRQAGMAEVATGVLHNVGNVLNSVNVSATLVADNVRKSRSASLAKVVALLREHESDLGAFITTDIKGKQIPAFLATLAEHLDGERTALLQEIGDLQKNVEHIKDIVAMQQTYAKVSGVTEVVQVRDLVEDALRMNGSALDRHHVQATREFEEVPPITVEKHKVLQILVNLIRNAKYACDEGGPVDKRLTVRIANGNDRVKIVVADNGVGIPPENLFLIFNHGFTTRKDGHGFGLHSGALAAKQMGGSLTVHSDGSGCGATFTLELPIQISTHTS